MKYFFTGLLLFAYSAYSLVYAQAYIEKDSWQVNVALSNLSFERNSNSSTSKTVSLAPGIGYAISKNLIVGVGVPLNVKTENISVGYTYRRTGIGLSPYFQYFLGNSRVKPFVGLAYSYNFDSYKFVLDTKTLVKRGSSHYIIPHLGAAIFLNERVLLNSTVSYGLESYEPKSFISTSPSGTISIANTNYKSLYMGLGVQYKLGK